MPGSNVIPLYAAKLCLNCDSIYTYTIESACPACASAQWEWLCKWVPLMQSRRQPTIATAANAQETEVPE